jgi:hypothetical protein
MSTRSKDSLQIILQVVATHKQWVADTDIPEMRDRNLAYIREGLSHNNPGREANIADAVRRIGGVYGSTGIVDVAEGRLAVGWQNIHLACLYKSMAARIKLSLFERISKAPVRPTVPALELEATRFALCLSYGLVFDDEFSIRTFERGLRTILADATVVSKFHWHYHTIEPFVIALLDHSTLVKMPPECPASLIFGPYVDVFKKWHQPSAFGTIVDQMCDYHCSRMIERSTDEFRSEFTEVPFDLFPVEILALFLIRQRLGFQNPPIDHPLLESPYAKPIGNPANIHDDLLNDLEIAF